MRNSANVVPPCAQAGYYVLSVWEKPVWRRGLAQNITGNCANVSSFSARYPHNKTTTKADLPTSQADETTGWRSSFSTLSTRLITNSMSYI